MPLIKFEDTFFCFHFLPFKVKVPYKVNIDRYSVVVIKDFWNIMEQHFKYKKGADGKNELITDIDMVAQMRLQSGISLPVVSLED